MAINKHNKLHLNTKNFFPWRVQSPGTAAQPNPIPPGSLPTPHLTQLFQIYPKILDVALPSCDTCLCLLLLIKLGLSGLVFQAAPDLITSLSPLQQEQREMVTHIHNSGTGQNSLSATCCWCCPSVVSTTLFSKLPDDVLL